GEQLLDMGTSRRDSLFSRLAVRDVAPRADDLVRFAAFGIGEAQLIAHPAIVAVLLQEPVFESVVALLEQLPELALPPCKIVRMHRISPEVGAVEIVALLVAQPLLDVLADIGRAKIPRCLEAVNHRRGGSPAVARHGPASRRWPLRQPCGP